MHEARLPKTVDEKINHQKNRINKEHEKDWLKVNSSHQQKQPIKAKQVKSKEIK